MAMKQCVKRKHTDSVLSKRWRTGFAKETLTYFSLYSASVNSNRGWRDLLSAFRMSVSCHMGMKCQVVLSVDRT